MGRLQVSNLTTEVPLRSAMQVDMDEWAVSRADPLATVGAGPCMNVVVHDPNSNQGGLAHVWNVAYDVDQIDLQRSFQRHELYHKACFTVLDMMRRGLRSTGPFDVWLGAGGAFVEKAGMFIKEDSVLYDFPAYVVRFMAEAGIQVTVIDNRKVKNSGDIIYWPALAAVYFLNNPDATIAVQTGRKSPESGKCR
jgi:hypothetical protein